jgi:SAM-dependent methyltransferase
MPSIEENKLVWEVKYDWGRAGNEWSGSYGGVDMHWYATLLPRIHTFVPTGTILEIAPGFGRWTQFLKELCQQLTIVDLSAKCIEACQARFADCAHINYHVNDGKSLAMVADASVDFAFSFDSLVHVEADVVEAYLAQLAHKLTPEGVGVIHHSNLAEYARYLGLTRRLAQHAPRLSSGLARLGVVEVLDSQWRAASLSADRFRTYAHEVGLHCLSQEKINWGGSKRLMDCISVVTRKCSRWVRPTRTMRNTSFMREQDYIFRQSRLYGADSFRV